MNDTVDGDGIPDAIVVNSDGGGLDADDGNWSLLRGNSLSYALVARVSVCLNFWLQQVSAGQGIYIHPACELTSRVHDGHKFVYNAVVLFLDGCLRLLAMCVC